MAEREREKIIFQNSFLILVSFFFTNLVSSWKLSRTTNLSAQAIADMNAVINQTQGLRQQYYEATDQSEDACFYVPELNVNEAPIFRGQCDENVVGLTNFDASRVSVTEYRSYRK